MSGDKLVIPDPEEGGEPPDWALRWRRHFGETMEEVFPEVDLSTTHPKT